MDIHNYQKRLERTLENIKNSKEVSRKNKKLIIDFHDFCFSEGLSVSKIERYLYDLFRFAKSMEKDLNKTTKRDMQKVVAEIEKKEWTPNSKHTFKVMLKKFYRFVANIDEKGVYPENIKWLRTNVKNNHKKLPEELLTEEEIELMIRNAKTTRDKAFISVLSESGCRIGEVANLKIKDVVFDEYGARITICGKTGARKIRLVNSAPYLQEWLNNHPFNQDSDSYIWVRGDGKPLSYGRISELLKRIGEIAKIKKRIYCHLFRHGRATFLAKHLTEAQMKDCLGWTQSSKMAGIYVHLSGRDTDDAILKLNGLKIEEEKKEQKLKPKVCLRCKTINEATNRFCKICGFVLDNETAKEVIKREADKSDMNNLMTKLVEDKEILEFLVRKIKEKELTKKE